MLEIPETEVYIDFDGTIANTGPLIKTPLGLDPKSIAISQYFIDNPEARGIAAYILKKSGPVGLQNYIKYTRDILVQGVFREFSALGDETYILTAAKMQAPQRARIKKAIPGILDESIIIVPRQEDKANYLFQDFLQKKIMGAKLPKKIILVDDLASKNYDPVWLRMMEYAFEIRFEVLEVCNLSPGNTSINTIYQS